MSIRRDPPNFGYKKKTDRSIVFFHRSPCSWEYVRVPLWPSNSPPKQLGPNLAEFWAVLGRRCLDVPLEVRTCAMVKSRYIGDKLIPPLIGNPYNGYINPYYWVDEFIPCYMEMSWEFRPWHTWLGSMAYFTDLNGIYWGYHPRTNPS